MGCRAAPPRPLAPPPSPRRASPARCGPTRRGGALGGLLGALGLGGRGKAGASPGSSAAAGASNDVIRTGACVPACCVCEGEGRDANATLCQARLVARARGHARRGRGSPKDLTTLHVR